MNFIYNISAHNKYCQLQLIFILPNYASSVQFPPIKTPYLMMTNTSFFSLLALTYIGFQENAITGAAIGAGFAHHYRAPCFTLTTVGIHAIPFIIYQYKVRIVNCFAIHLSGYIYHIQFLRCEFLNFRNPLTLSTFTT